MRDTSLVCTLFSARLVSTHLCPRKASSPHCPGKARQKRKARARPPPTCLHTPCLARQTPLESISDSYSSSRRSRTSKATFQDFAQGLLQLRVVFILFDVARRVWCEMQTRVRARLRSAPMHPIKAFLVGLLKISRALPSIDWRRSIFCVKRHTGRKTSLPAGSRLFTRHASRFCLQPPASRALLARRQALCAAKLLIRSALRITQPFRELCLSRSVFSSLLECHRLGAPSANAILINKIIGLRLFNKATSRNNNSQKCHLAQLCTCFPRNSIFQRARSVSLNAVLNCETANFLISNILESFPSDGLHNRLVVERQSFLFPRTTAFLMNGMRVRLAFANLQSVGQHLNAN